MIGFSPLKRTSLATQSQAGRLAKQAARPYLAVGIMVRNEEDVIVRTLDSVQDFAHVVKLYDTYATLNGGPLKLQCNLTQSCPSSVLLTHKALVSKAFRDVTPPCPPGPYFGQDMGNVKHSYPHDFPNSYSLDFPTCCKKLFISPSAGVRLPLNDLVAMAAGARTTRCSWRGPGVRRQACGWIYCKAR